MPALLLPALLLLPAAVAAPELPRVLTLDRAPLHAEPDPTSAVTHTLPADRVGRALAVGTALHKPASRDWLGLPMVLVQVDGQRGWVHAEHVALERVFGDGGDWVGERMGAREVGAATVWAAARDGQEWSDKWEGWDRPVHEGWLVVQRGARVHRIPWSSSNGWGTSRGAERVVWRDWTGDGVADPMVVVHETVTEAGSAGRRLQVWDLAGRAPRKLLDQPVHDPHWNGLMTEDTWGWIDVHVGERRIRTHEITHRPTAGQHPAGPGTEVLQMLRQEVRWQGSQFVHEAAVGVPLVVRLGDVGLRAGPEEDAPAIRPAPGTWCIGQTRGPLGVGDAFQAELRRCTGDQAPIGWATSTDIELLDPMVAEILGLWPDEPGPYVRFDWDRPAPPR